LKYYRKAMIYPDGQDSENSLRNLCTDFPSFKSKFNERMIMSMQYKLHSYN